MSQNDYVIANQTTPLFRADLNLALQALASTSSGATAPATTYANMLWYDTSANTLYMRSEADDAWIALGTLDQDANTFTPAGLTNLTQIQAEDDTSTVFGQVSGQRLGQAVAANVPAPTPPTTSEVLSATAGAAFGAIGTYAFLYSGNNVSIVNGSDYAGSDLFAAGIWKDGSTISTDGTTSDILATRGGTAQSGTWKAMGRVNVASSAGNDTRITLFLRIA